MDFDNALASLNEGRAAKCRAALWLETLDETNHAKVLDALDRMPAHTVLRACQKMGCDVSASTWAKHAQKACRCPQ